MKLFKGKFCKLIFGAMLGLAVMGGAPLRPDEVEELLAAMNVPKVACTLADESDQGDDTFKNLWRENAD